METGMLTRKEAEHGRDLAAERYVVQSEHARLRDLVVEAAKRRRKAKLAALGNAGDYLVELHAAMTAEHVAVDALIAFEAEHKIGE